MPNKLDTTYQVLYLRGEAKKQKVSEKENNINKGTTKWAPPSTNRGEHHKLMTHYNQEHIQETRKEISQHQRQHLMCITKISMTRQHPLGITKLLTPRNSVATTSPMFYQIRKIKDLPEFRGSVVKHRLSWGTL